MLLVATSLLGERLDSVHHTTFVNNQVGLQRYDMARADTISPFHNKSSSYTSRSAFCSKAQPPG